VSEFEPDVRVGSIASISTHPPHLRSDSNPGYGSARVAAPFAAHAVRCYPSHNIWCQLELFQKNVDPTGQANDLLLGAAKYYERYRVPYPQEVFDWIVNEYRLDGCGRLLDGGCGTGQAAVLRDRRKSFENDLRGRLSRLSAEDRFAEEIAFSIVSARATASVTG
jgi:hypothetical protein